MNILKKQVEQKKTELNAKKTEHELMEISIQRLNQQLYEVRKNTSVNLKL